MRISVVICTYNRAEILRQTLEGFVAVAGAAPSPWELIVVDNNSSDATAVVCQAFAAKLPLRYIKEPRPGKSCALNTGIDTATGELIALTDDDVDVEQGWMGALVSAATSYPSADFFGGKVLSRWQGQPPRWFVENKDMLRSNPRVDLGEEAITLRRGSEPALIGANLAFRRALFVAKARFREDLGPKGDGSKGGRVGPEEFEWEARLLDAGHEGIYVPDAVVHHRDPLWRMTGTYVRHWYVQAGRSRAKEGKVPPGHEWFGAPRYLWRELLTNAAKFLCTRVGPSRVWLSAQCRMCLAWGSIVECRAAGNAPSKPLAARFRWRMECLTRWINGVLVRMGPGAFIWFHRPWPLRKIYMRPALKVRCLGGGLGDELMCLPIFEEIKRRNPACRISFVTRRPAFFRSQPQVDEVLTQPPKRGAVTLTYNFVIPPPRPLISMMAECAGIKGRFRRIPAPIVTPSSGAKSLIESLARPLVVVQPVASGWTTNKNWPLPYWKRCARLLAADFQVLEVGTEAVLPAEEMGARFVSMAGETSLDDFAYYISQADLFIGPSSSGMHLANAYDIPALIIFGGYESPVGYDFPNVHALYSPVDCAPCWRQDCPYDLKCLHAIEPEVVVEKAVRLLGKSGVPQKN
jgi:ADP-heptose:LPS heptosyltransferase/glycosyltransferase involved in cell wall biosynthesis